MCYMNEWINIHMIFFFFTTLYMNMNNQTAFGVPE